MAKCLIVLIALIAGTVLAAPVWTWVDENGVRHYSDRQVPGATQIEIGEAQTFSGSASRSAEQPTAATQTGSPGQAAAAASYSILDIISPESEQTFWNIGGSLPVSIATFPALQSAHQIDVLLDGERRELGTRSLEFSLEEVWRGEHTLQALIVDANGQIVMRSAPVTFFVQQTSIRN